MKTRPHLVTALAVLTALTAAPGLALAKEAPREQIAPAFKSDLPNAPGKSLIGAVVTYPPGGTTPAHHHAKSAFITGYVLEGAIRSQVNGGEVKVYKKGESFTENPGDAHGVSENASKTKPAKLLAIFVVDSADTELTTFDAK